MTSIDKLFNKKVKELEIALGRKPDIIQIGCKDGIDHVLLEVVPMEAVVAGRLVSSRVSRPSGRRTLQPIAVLALLQSPELLVDDL